MAWTTLPTYSDGNALTGAQMNAIADNIEESAVAKATTAGQYFVATAANVLAARTIAQGTTNTSDSTTSGAYTSLSSTGPDLSCTTGTSALVWINAQQENSAGSVGTWTSFAVSGATTVAADDDWAILTNTAASQAVRAGACKLQTGLTAGTNSFDMRYKVNGNTGTWTRRRVQVMSL